MALLDDVKVALRISSSTTAFDGEVQDLITAARHDLVLSGVVAEKAENEGDPLIKRAIMTYCKVHFGYDNPDADRLARAYEMLKAHLSLAGDYSAYTITFTVTDGVNPIKGATVTIGDEKLVTNSLGTAVYSAQKAGVDLDYTVTASGYQAATGCVYVDGSKLVEVTMVAA